MNVSRGFHAKYPTSIGNEIETAESLHHAALLRWGMWKLPTMLRTDPAAVLRKMAYCRIPADGWVCVAGVPYEEHTRATNAEILTPSHPEWEEFQDRLDAHLLCGDFDDYFGASQVVTHDSIHTEYWPLCSASLIADMGFAVAETLTVFQSFLGSSDRDIAECVERHWKSRKPSKIRPAFDGDTSTPFIRQDKARRGSSQAESPQPPQ